jgi:hypothetical protein
MSRPVPGVELEPLPIDQALWDTVEKVFTHEEFLGAQYFA